MRTTNLKMHPQETIYVAGHQGLAGSAILRALRAQGYTQCVTRTRAQCDLTDKHAVDQLFSKEQPDYVFLAAAKVGGIGANAQYPAEFIAQNIAIQSHVIDAAYRYGVKRLLFLGSSCIYPRDCVQPIEESALLTGPLEWTNRPYAIAKISGIEMCWAYNRQYGTQFLAAMPTNLFGLGDRYHIQNAHVIPAIMQKMHIAKMAGDSEVVLWGTGTARREFLYSEDLGQACVFLMNLPDPTYQQWTANRDQPPILNVGTGVDITIAALAEKIRAVVGFTGKIRFDAAYPDGTPRKCLNVDQCTALGWRATVSLDVGLRAAYADFLKTAAQVESCDATLC